MQEDRGRHEAQEKLIAVLCAYLKERFGCRTAILYGSRARGDWDDSSDIDVIAFSETSEAGHVANLWNGLFLDLFLYPPEARPDLDWLRIHEGRVLFQFDAEGDAALKAVAEMFSAGPEPLPPSEVQTQHLWLEKMLARAEKGGPEGDYRRRWLLQTLPEIYFTLNGLWYLGPKRSLAFLQQNKPDHFEALRRAFAHGATIADIRAAVAVVNGT
jgi:hypothetical protein